MQTRDQTLSSECLLSTYERQARIGGQLLRPMGVDVTDGTSLS
ncbi:hypothetical protein [Novipirellula aureliae]|nr:hypothetical protein [Novipirellula aureliae]